MFIIIYLYFLSQTLFRYRLLDLNELLGRMVVLATLVLILTLIYGLLVRWVRSRRARAVLLQHAGGVDHDRHPDRAAAHRVEGADQSLDVPGEVRAVARIEKLRAELTNVIDMRELVPRVLAALEDSRRVTHASIYLVDPDGSGYELAGHIGPRPEERLDAVAHRAFFERLRRAGVISLEGLEREMAARRTRTSEEQESLQLMLRDPRGDERLGGAGYLRRGQLLGCWSCATSACARRTRPTRSSSSAAWRPPIGVTLQNSQVYERMKERDRLAALGQMAAGLAHEIRNPLGVDQGRRAVPAADRRRGPGTRRREAPRSSSTSSSRR